MTLYKPSYHKIDINKDFLEKEYYSGKTYQQLADKLGVDKSTIRSRIKEFNIIARPPRRRRFDVFDDKFKHIKVICVIASSDKKHPHYLCECECGKRIIVSGYALSRGQKGCQQCASKLKSINNWKGYGEISGELWKQILKSASVRNYNVRITIEEVWHMFLKQDRKCALSGVELKFYRSRADRSKTTASLDRIDSDGHYTLDNVQWVHKILNNLKMDLPQEEFIKWCKLVAKYHE